MVAADFVEKVRINPGNFVDGKAFKIREYTDEQYQAACLVDRGGDEDAKARCSLPVLEPDGEVNLEALKAAERSLVGGTTGQVTYAQRQDAARTLIRYMRLANVEPTTRLFELAAR